MVPVYGTVLGAASEPSDLRSQGCDWRDASPAMAALGDVLSWRGIVSILDPLVPGGIP